MHPLPWINWSSRKFKSGVLDFSDDDAVVRSLSANAGQILHSIPGPGRFHMSWSN